MDKSITKGKLLLFLIMVITLYTGFSTYDSHFQADSETLVTGRLRGELENLPAGKYPLTRYQNIYGNMKDYNVKGYSDDECLSGYFKKESAFLLPNDYHNKEIIEKAVSIKDINDKEYKIRDFIKSGNYVRVNLLTDDILTEANNGKIENLKFIDQTGTPLVSSRLYDYNAQFGLQGIVFLKSAPSNLSFEKYVSKSHKVCMAILAVILAMICYLLYAKYNLLLAACFYVTFLTSPWIINFSPNLYWVEFTWFIPMLIGLWATTTDISWKYRFAVYATGLLAITIKCLCGYEYISTIILGMVLFPLIEAYALWKKQEKETSYKFIRLTIGLCFIGVVGFAIAMAMHGYVRGDGDIAAGIQSIYQHDVLRRTWNTDINSFGDKFAPSLSASLFTVLGKYLTFRTTVVLGIPGKLFLCFALSPIVLKIYYWNIHKSVPYGAEVWALYVFSFLATVSWLVLAKSHSFVHTHMNYVLWYFGFVQCCLYSMALALKERLTR